MANTFTSRQGGTVQNRASLIQPEWKDELYKYITGIVQKKGHKLIAINGTANHVHIFTGYKLHQLIPELMQDVKGSSSKWINEKKFVRGKFSWSVDSVESIRFYEQEGYGSFSYSHSQIDQVVRYINNQEKHHKKQSFREEYILLLKKFNIQFDEKYILKDVE